jgi:hypothetical protein
MASRYRCSIAAGRNLMARTDLAIRLDAPADRLRRTADKLRPFGGDVDIDWLIEIIDRQIGSTADARLARRDVAVAALAQTYVGRRWTMAGNVSTELRRYASTAWRRRDQNLDTPPSEYLAQPRRLAAFEAMRADPKAAGLGQKQISRILASVATAQNAITTNEDSAVNALTPQSNAEFIEAMKRAPAGRAVIQAETARVIASRQKLIDELAALDAKAAVDFPKLDKAVQSEIAATRASEDALRAQNDKLRAANFAKSGAVIAYDAGRQRIEAELRARPAAKIIDEFQISMRDEIDAAMRKHEGGRIQENRPLARNPQERILVHGYGNRASVAARLDAIHAAIAAADSLRLAADQGDLAAKLDALRAGLPAIESAVIPTF